MGIDNLKNLFFFLFLFVPLFVLAQPNDCRRSIVICDDRPFSFTPKFGAGLDDFLNSKNSQGCLERRENISVWFYFEFRKDMPANAGISFTLADSVRYIGQDYDFAIYGPDLYCDSLGQPLRCSFAQISPNQSVIRTGLGNGAKDTSEGLEGDGFVDSMVVQPGQGFLMVIDFFVGVGGASFDSTIAQSFRLTWGGTAAPYLNCIANPNCDQVVVDAGPDKTVCADTELNLQVDYANTNGGEQVRWTGLGSANAFIEQPDSVQTRIRIPKDAEGVYVFVVAVEEGNCFHSDTVRIVVHPIPFPEIQGDRLVCPGQQVWLFGGTGFKEYNWSPGGASTDSVWVGAPGVYELVVSNSWGCIGSDTFLLSTKRLPIPRISGELVFCIGASTELTVDSGFLGYQWSNGGATRSIRVDQPGIYSVTLTDSDGCTVSASQEVRRIIPTPPIISGPDYYCVGSSATIRVNQGYMQYRWSNGSTVDSITVGTPGMYRVEVVDSFGCAESSEFTIFERQNPEPNILGNRLFCLGDSIELTVGSGFSQYRWSAGGIGLSAVINQPGRYEVTVTDAFGCTGIDGILADTFPVPKPLITGQTILCTGDFARITPGVFRSYEWSTGDIFPDILVDKNGTYRVTVTDLNGCMASASTEVIVHPKPTPVIYGPTTLCPETSVGLRLDTVYASYLWSTEDTSAAITVHRGGVYQVTVTNKEGCSASSQLEVYEVSRPVVAIMGDSVICAGTPAFWQSTAGFSSYRWSTGAETSGIEVTDSKLYSVTATDSFGCTAVDTLSLQVLDNPPVVISGPLRFCSGTFISLGVTEAYAGYQWSTGSRDSSIFVQASGLYGLTVTAANGCTRSDSVEVVATDPVLPGLQSIEYALCERDTIRFEAGAGFLSYRWSDGSTQAYLEVFDPGSYELTVVDSNQCRTSIPFKVAIQSIVKPTIFGPPSFCADQSAQFIAGGGSYATFAWSTGENTSSIVIEQGGTYYLTVTNSHGCTAVTQKEIVEKPVPEIEITGDLSICRGDSTVLMVPGGYSNYTWTTGAIDTSIVVHKAGPYGILVLGANGCAVADEVEVVQSKIPYPVIDGDRFFCSRESVVLEVLAGFPAYAWSTGESGNRIEVNQNGIYGVTVYDDLGCQGFAQVRVISVPSPEPKIEGTFVFCPGDSAFLEVKDSFLRFNWFPDGVEAQSRFIKTPGWYTVEVEASNGCKARDSIEATFLPAPVPQITGDAFFCEDSMATVAIRDTFSTILWSSGETDAQIRVRQPATVYVHTTNGYGCMGMDSFAVAYVERPVSNPGPDTFFTCSRRSIRLGPPLDQDYSGYVAFWNGPGIVASGGTALRPIVNQVGTYTMTLRDTLYGCTAYPKSVEVRDIAYVPDAFSYAEDTLDCITPFIFLNGEFSQRGSQFVYAWYQEGNNTQLSDSIRVRISTPGRYSFELTDTLTGCRNEAILEIGLDTLAPVPEIEEFGVLNCTVQAVELVARTTPTWSFSWAYAGQKTPFSDTNQVWVAREPGTYSLAVLDAKNGCIGFLEVLVGIDTIKPLIDAGPDTEIDCNTRETTLYTVEPNTLFTYRWRDVATGFILSRTDTLLVELPGPYLLEGIDPHNGCIGSDTAWVTENTNVPNAIDLLVRPETCAGQADGSVRVVQVEGGEMPYIYRISGKEGFTATPGFSALAPGDYRLTVQDARGCEHTQRFSIYAGLSPILDLGADQQIKLGDQIRLLPYTNIDSGAIGQLIWTLPDTLKNKQARELKIQPIGSTLYAATVRDTNGCNAADEVWIFVEASQRVYIPNAFSPNGDGTNDVFMLFSGPEVVRVKSLQLYDRWGIRVFEKTAFQPNDPLFGWDGMYRGKLQNAGVYVYYVEVEFLDGRVEGFKGDVTLVR